MKPAEVKQLCELIWNSPGVARTNHKAAWKAEWVQEGSLFYPNPREALVVTVGALAPAARLAEANRKTRLKRLVEKHQRLR